MKKNKIPVRFTGQHFTIDQVLIIDAIKFADLKKDETVLDIGAGKGYITIHLKHQKKVIAIENDPFLINLLRKKLSANLNIRIVGSDFRNFKFPNKMFKVVSSIPYRITADILKSLMFTNIEYFMGGSIIMQLEPASKLVSGRANNPYTIFYCTFFDFKIMYEVPSSSFIPPPKVKSALLRICKKKSPDIGFDLKDKYLDFLFFILRYPDVPVRTALKKLFRKSQVRQLADSSRINIEMKVSTLSASELKYLFLKMLVIVPEKLHP